MSLELNPHVTERLRSDEIAWLNTVRPDGRPHSIPVWFLWEEESILIFSKPDNQKIRNLRQNHFVTLTLDNTRGGGDVVILEGTAELLEVGAANASIPTYNEKYSDGLKRIGVSPENFTKLYSQPIRIAITRLVG
ncbi:TIGR03667 family PPOX class F420-dependent oxidoreductase [Tengunoibacter tsumagoiensis]|uniref:Pyridoxamine 5'-phosphate oxidase N-terminal domain-containing protein n=1 Tax=Tengunoibacter tsumagoiensis TaxID=2014871 RepID=A0A402A3X7_9CHLR|nr:TIGR03667 family PPOX class F420-dependent oxidoreductase [Tengunoibacter tsumagoiensis]GCE13701.1 hypothetical protein KTT_35600 [Tengunoibacter tsumagoiensis]